MRIYLAGALEMSGAYPKLLKSRYILEPYVWFDGKKPDVQERLMSLVNNENFLLDSGAYSFMNALKGKPADFDAYLERYIQFINRFGIRYFFELDLDSVIGYERTLAMTRLLEQETGRKCIPVFHKSRGLAEWERMCKEYEYVAIGTIYEYQRKESVLVKLLDIAKQYGTKVHGLGFTSCKKLKRVKFYSVDSTSWVMGQKAGQIGSFNGDEVVSYNPPKGFRVKHYKVAEELTIEAWLQYQKYAEDYL